MTPFYYFLSFVFLFLVSPIGYAETHSLLVNSIYLTELFIMSAVLLALVFILILVLNERSRRVKKTALFYEDLDQKMGVMQMMMNSVREKEKNIIKIAQTQSSNVVSLPTDVGDEIESNHKDAKRAVHSENNEIPVDPRTLDVNGKLKQPHLGRSNYLLAMKEAHSKGLSRVVSIDDFLQKAIADAVSMSDGNIEEIDSFYQKLSELIKTLEADNKRESNQHASSQKMLDALNIIQADFEELMKHQQYNQSTYKKVSARLVDSSHHLPEEVVTAVLEK